MLEAFVEARAAAEAPGRILWRSLYSALEEDDWEEARSVLERETARYRALAAAYAEAEAVEAEQAAWDSQAEIIDEDAPAWAQARRLAGKSVWVYHGTSSALLERILSDGLDPAVEERTWDEATPGCVYLTALGYESFLQGGGTAEFYAKVAASKWGGRPVVLRLIVPWDHLLMDEDDADLKVGDHQFCYPGLIPPDWIREIDGERIEWG